VGCESTVMLCLNLMLTRCSNRMSILLTAKTATGKGHGEFRRVLTPSGGRVT
jgi:hypothetical protein